MASHIEAAKPSLSEILTDKRKAILQRFLIERVCGRQAARVFYGKLFSEEAPDFNKPLQFNIENLSHWSVAMYDFNEKFNRADKTGSFRLLTDGHMHIHNKVLGETTVDIHSIMASNQTTTDLLSKSIVFSRLPGFEFMSYSIGENDDMYAKPSPNGTEIRRKWEDVYDTISSIKYPGLGSLSEIHNYQGTDYLILNAYAHQVYSKMPLKPYDYDRVLTLKNEIERIAQHTIKNIPHLGLSLQTTPLYVYSGVFPPIINSSYDIFTTQLPTFYRCTHFLSTSCDYKVAHNFADKYNSDGGKIMWKLRVLTTWFACLGQTNHGLAHKEKEFLFPCGQLIKIESISLSEYGHTVLNGSLISSAVPNEQSGGRRLPPSKKKGFNPLAELLPPMNITLTDSEQDDILGNVLDDILLQNEERDGTIDKPYLLMMEDIPEADDDQSSWK
jgi:hypothetical protein